LTGTVSPADAQKRFNKNRFDPLFVHDGLDEVGGGVTRILKDATILIPFNFPFNGITVDGGATSVKFNRGIPTTLNSPGLDNVIMLDGREPSLESQAKGATTGHAQGLMPSQSEAEAIARYEKTNAFFSTPELRRYFLGTGPAPGLQQGNTASEKRGRIFFEDVPGDPTKGFKPGLCGHCHAGTMLNETSVHAPEFVGAPVPPGTRFFSVGVSEFNRPGNTMHTFTFPDGSTLTTPDPGRALISGNNPAFNPNPFDPTAPANNAVFLTNVNAFKIASLRGVKNTAPYFHDNSAKTLEAVAAHYAEFFFGITGGFINITPQDQQDIVAYLKLLE
jgi:cytochrome c peroxidase